MKSSNKSLPQRNKNITVIAVFGSLWGLVEITLGVTLKGMRIPMAGAILTAIIIIVFLTGKYFSRQKGAILMMGGIAALLKIFSIGTVIAGPFLAILIEALIAEVMIIILGVNRISYLITGMTLLVYTILHPFISQGLIFGENIYTIYLEMFTQMSKVINSTNMGVIALGYVALHVVIGFVSGLVAWNLSKAVEREIEQIRKKSDKDKFDEEFSA